MKTRKLRKIVIPVMIISFLMSWYNTDIVKAEPGDTGIKNAMDDAISGELVGLCNQLGLFTVDEGSEWPVERPMDWKWLAGKNIATKKLPRYYFHGIEKQSHYDVDLTYGSLFGNKWPYDKQYKGGDGRMHPTIGDVCAALGIPQVKNYTVDNGGFHDASYGQRKYDDVNFTEILSIMSQGEKGNWRTVTYHDFNDFIRREEAQNLYYECDVNWWMYYEWEEHVWDPHKEEWQTIIHGMHIDCGHGKDGEGTAQGMPPYRHDGGHTWMKTKYYAKVKVKPMGLRELYMLSDVYPSDINDDFYLHTNYELLNHQEDYTYTYLRIDKEMNPVNYFDLRSKLSPIYEELKEYYGVARGRSAPYYIEEPYNLEANPIAEEYTKAFQFYDEMLSDWDINWDGDISEAQSMILALAQQAIGKIGYVYAGKTSGTGWEAIAALSNKDDKNRTNGLDCSGFVQWVYRSTVGVNLPGSCSGYKGKKEVSKSELQPGMIGVMYGTATATRSGNHMGIYAGKDSSGKDLWIHCTGSSGVVINSYGGFSHYYDPLGG